MMRGPESDRIIAAGGKWLCQDWPCPASASCARHFGRSAAYAAMAEKHPPLVMPPREASEDHCGEYERDKPKDWLMRQPGQLFPALPPAAGMRI